MHPFGHAGDVVRLALLGAVAGALPGAFLAAAAMEAGRGGEERPEPANPPARTRAWKPWLALAAVGACAVLMVLWGSAVPAMMSHGVLTVFPAAYTAGDFGAWESRVEVLSGSRPASPRPE